MISDVRRSIHYLAKDAGILQTVGYIQALLLQWLGSPLALSERMVTMLVGKPSHLHAFVGAIEGAVCQVLLESCFKMGRVD